MRISSFVIIFIVLMGLLIPIAAAEPVPNLSLSEGFVNPPRSYSMAPFWSWNGRLDPDILRWQIDEMVDKGVYGAFMHARGGLSAETPYFSDAWWEAIEACVTHGSEVGFYTWLYDEDKWPSGSAGGRVEARNPERSSQKALRITTQTVQGPRQVKVDIPEVTYAIAGRLIEAGVIDPDTITMLNAQDLNETWACPEGNWMLFGYSFGPSGHHGVNHLDPATTRDFIEITHEEYYRRFGEYFGTTIPGVFFDEIQNAAGKDPEQIVWAEIFEERFRALKGYDIAPVLPALTVDIGPKTPKIRSDYYEVYTTLYEEAWFKQLGEWCADHDIAVTGHTVEDLDRYITQGMYMTTMRRLQIPLTDNEDYRYTWPRTIGAWKPKQIASVAHLYGQERVGAEAMGGAGWAFTLDSARQGFNMLAAYGVNFYIPHLFHYAMDTPDNVGDWPNSWFYRNPYWKYFKTFADYGNRLSYMLTGGEHIADVAILYPESNQWAGHGPGTTQETLEDLVAMQIDTEIIDPNSLMRARIEGKDLVAGGMRYKAIVVPGLTCMRRAEADILLEFLQAGGLVILHDRWPTESMDEGRDDPHMRRFKAEAEQAGLSVSALEDTSALLDKHTPRDVRIQGEGAAAVRYHHVRRGKHDVYWLANDSLDRCALAISFRVTGAPSVWDPETGAITPIASTVQADGRTGVSLNLNGRQGVFIVLDTANVPHADLTPPMATNEVARSLPSVTVDSPWQFLPVGDQLDNAWRIDVDETLLEIPIMRVRWERNTGEVLRGWEQPGFDDSRWRTVKVRDSLHAEEGANRYRSRWVARHISYKQYTPFDLDRFFMQPMGGAGLACRKTLVLPPETTRAWLAVRCESPFRIYINGEEQASGQGGSAPERFELRFSRAGESTVSIVAEDAETILAEGQLVSAYGAPIPVFTDKTWDVKVDGEAWMEAWEYLAPPEQPLGDPDYPQPIPLPDTVWYRQTVPIGATTLFEPVIQGDWEAWLDGVPISFNNGVVSIPSPHAPGILALRVRLAENDRGLMEPIKVQCTPIPLPLASWTEHHLAWYSGRSLYSTTCTLDEAYFLDSQRLELDLGKVAYCVEIWINGTLAGTRIWPPYRIDVTEYLHPGDNKIDIVVANLLANRMAWDIFDDSRSNLTYRRWHDSILRRDAWCFESGLIGPVRIHASL